MKKNAGNNKDPYLLSLSNLCMQMYQNSDGHRGLIPQFDNSAYTGYLSKLEKDAWDGINQPGEVRLCADETFSELVELVYWSAGDAVTPLRDLFLFLHAGGWKDIYDIRKEKERTGDQE